MKQIELPPRWQHLLVGLPMMAYVVLYLVVGCVKDQRMPMPQSYVPHTEAWPMGQKAVLTIYDDATGNRLGSMMVREEPQVIKNEDGTWEVILR